MNKSEDVHSNKNIARSAGVIGLATLVSRVLGFIRDIVIARLFGVYVYAQAFVIAFKIPNLFRDLVGEGATNAAIVPVFSEYVALGKVKQGWRVFSSVFWLLLILGGVPLSWIPGFDVFLSHGKLAWSLSPGLLCAIVLAMLATCLFASWAPASKATRIEPAAAYVME